jgi:ribose transport system ATP-binding protein
VDDFILRISNITKTFPGVRALDNVSFSVKKGSVHGLIGENGAGKSTLMKILYGNHIPDSGDIYIDGKKIKIDSPLKAVKNGLSIIFQELNLAPEISVAENIFIGRLKQFKRYGRIKWDEVHLKAKQALEVLGYSIDTKSLVKELSVAEQQMIEIAKALSYNSKIVLMDEPSSSLTEKELRILFEIIGDLKKKGISIIYITHKIEEVIRLCDTVTVIRDGKVIDTSSIDKLTKESIIQKMIGREITTLFPKIDYKPGEEVLRVDKICRKGVVEDVSFSLYKGEVLGIAGLVGSGRTEISRIIFGADYYDSGMIFVRGKKVVIRSPKEAMKNRIAYLTEDRKNEGLLLNFTVSMNLSTTNLNSIAGNLFLSSGIEKKFVKSQIEKFNIKTPSSKQKVYYLSGGNQQKIVVAKWLNTKADIFIFDEPTCGIDVGSKYEIYLIIKELAEQGKSIIFISSELLEVQSLSNRIIVMRNGRISGELSNREISAENIAQYML